MAWMEGGTLVQGALQSGDATNPRDGSFVDRYPLSVSTAQTLVVGVESNTFDPYVEVMDSQSKRVAFDDDSGPDVDAYMAADLAPGSYTIQVTTFSSGTQGSYHLKQRLFTPQWQVTQQGTLGSLSQRHPQDQSWMDTYAIAGKARQSLLLEVSSKEFDPLIQLLDPLGKVVAQKYDVTDSKTAVLVFYLRQSGNYTVRVNTFTPGQSGNYTLHYTQGF